MLIQLPVFVVLYGVIRGLTNTGRRRHGESDSRPAPTTSRTAPQLYHDLDRPARAHEGVRPRPGQQPLLAPFVLAEATLALAVSWPSPSGCNISKCASSIAATPGCGAGQSTDANDAALYAAHLRLHLHPDLGWSKHLFRGFEPVPHRHPGGHLPLRVLQGARVVRKELLRVEEGRASTPRRSIHGTAGRRPAASARATAGPPGRRSSQEIGRPLEEQAAGPNRRRQCRRQQPPATAPRAATVGGLLSNGGVVERRWGRSGTAKRAGAAKPNGAGKPAVRPSARAAPVRGGAGGSTKAGSNGSPGPKEQPPGIPEPQASDRERHVERWNGSRRPGGRSRRPRTPPSISSVSTRADAEFVVVTEPQGRPVRAHAGGGPGTGPGHAHRAPPAEADQDPPLRAGPGGGGPPRWRRVGTGRRPRGHLGGGRGRGSDARRTPRWPNHTEADADPAAANGTGPSPPSGAGARRRAGGRSGGGGQQGAPRGLSRGRQARDGASGGARPGGSEQGPGRPGRRRRKLWVRC